MCFRKNAMVVAVMRRECAEMELRWTEVEDLGARTTSLEYGQPKLSQASRERRTPL